jgi:hypothetical protein
MSSNAQQFDFIVIGCGSGGSACADRALAYGAKVCLIERGYPHLVSSFARFIQTFLQFYIRRRHQTGSRSRWNVRAPLRLHPTILPSVCAAHTCSTCSCVNVGCVPKKLMFEAAHVMERCCNASTFMSQPHRQPASLPLSLPNRIHGKSSTASGFGIDVGGVSFDWARLKQARDHHTRGLPPSLRSRPSSQHSRFSSQHCSWQLLIARFYFTRRHQRIFSELGQRSRACLKLHARHWLCTLHRQPHG